MILRVGILILLDSSTSSHMPASSDIRIGAQHSIALPIASVARRSESVGSFSQWFQMIGAEFIRFARSIT